jgi:secondary thiamine-phosphate synthase enzyme
MVIQHEMFVMTDDRSQMVPISNEVKKIVESSKITEGVVFVITAHTTTGITVNEGLDCLVDDIGNTLDKLIPEEGEYNHAHFLPTYGRTSANVTGHLRGMLLGNHCVFPITDGKMIVGEAQEIFLAEFDGPQNRKIFIKIMGE